MAKKKLQARIRYYKADEKWPERYAIELYDSKKDTWNLSSSYEFVKRHDHPEAGDNFIYFGIVTEIFKLMNLGYDVEAP